jgi:site-specific DNA-methyltransferase (adenine-specific)/adenine-specific DNA-methyltransferase
VLVPFAGSGSECVAAVLEGRRFVGFELNADYVEIATARVAEVNKQQKIFAT